MNGQTVRLYGYETERKQIETAVNQNINLSFLCIHGVGGIGKTTLLRAMQENFSQNEAFRSTGLLDFDDLRLHIVQNILEEIASQLKTSDAPFAAFIKATKQLRDMQQRGISRLRVEDQEILTKKTFIQDIIFLAAKKRVVLFFDTIEKVQELSQWHELLNVLLQLKNTVIFLAGRRNDEVGDEIKKQIKKIGRVDVITLQGLSDAQARDYFTRTKLGKYLMTENPEQSTWVCQLCSGRPILLDLAVDWLGREADLEIPERPLAKSNEKILHQLKQDFERRLVNPITQYSNPENEAILDMAHAYHYFDAARHSFLHSEYSLKDSKALFESLRLFSFVKPQPGGGIRLHDEMQRMVEKHVWPILNPNKTRRRQLSKRIVQFYNQQLKSEEDEIIRQAIVAEQLYHELYTNINDGHQAFRPAFRKALGRYQLGFARLLLNTFLDFSNDFDSIFTAWANVHKGRLLRAEEKVHEAIDLIQPAKEILQSLDVREEMDTVCNVLGYCYRLLGDWEQAINAYEEALNYSLKERDAHQLAETMNNIANACRLGGDFERANRYSLVGLKIRERLEDKQGVGNSCYVRGMVSWETGNSAEAANYIKRARKLFNEVDYAEGIAEVDKYEGYIHFRTGDLTKALPLLKKAQAVFAEKKIGLGLADSLNLEARILIDMYAAEGEKEEGFQQVESLAQKALEVAERIRDYYKIAECHLSLCRVYYRWGRYYQELGDKDSAQKYYRLARQQYDGPEGGQLARQRNYLGPASVYEWTMGDIAYEADNWETAFDHYLQESNISSRFKEPRFARALNGLSDRLHRLPPTEDGSYQRTRFYCDYVIANWKERGLANDFPEVIVECESIKTFLGLVNPEYVAMLRQQGEDLLARGEWQRAMDIYQELLTVGQTYNPDRQVAEAMNQSAIAYRQMGHFVQARRFCQQSLLIGQRLSDEVNKNNSSDSQSHLTYRNLNIQVLIANSRLIMGTVMWATGNTNEAARYLRLARRLYREVRDMGGKESVEGEKGLALANRHSAFMHFGIGDNEEALNYLTQAEKTFRELNQFNELADALNLYAFTQRRIGNYGKAREYAEESLKLAEENGASYTIAEAWLTLGLIEYEEGQNIINSDLESAQQFFEKAKKYFANGYPIAERHGYELLLSVYESFAGNIAFDERRYAVAFEHYIQDLEFGARYERNRIRRELDRIVNRMVLLPKKMQRFYADFIITEWHERGLTEAEFDVPRLFELLKEYSEYV